MAKYNLIRNGRKIDGMNFTESEIKHLRKSGYAKKRGVKLVKERSKK